MDFLLADDCMAIAEFTANYAEFHGPEMVQNWASQSLVWLVDMATQSSKRLFDRSNNGHRIYFAGQAKRIHLLPVLAPRDFHS